MKQRDNESSAETIQLRNPSDSAQPVAPIPTVDQTAGRLPDQKGLSSQQEQLSRSNSADEATLATDSKQTAIPSRSNPNSPGSGSTSPNSQSHGTSIGRVFGDYRIEAEIARGGMGVVYRARQISLNRLVAIKMILSGKLAGEEDIRRFYVEAEAAAGLEHPNIVPIYEIGEIEGQHFFSMGYVDGGSLDRLLGEGTLDSTTAVQLMVAVTRAIQFAHNHGIIHRDLKPANILLAKETDTARASTSSLRNKPASSSKQPSANFHGTSLDAQWVPKVSDFGLAKQLNSSSQLTGTGQILGTPSYMPPEQAQGDNDAVGALSDVYSLGAILYRTLTGRPPFQSSSPMETILQLINQEPVAPRQLNPAVPVELETICSKCLQKDPLKRYASASELADDMERWLRGDPILARPISAWAKARRWVRKHPAACGSIGVVVLSIAAIVGILIKSNQSLSVERDIAVSARSDADRQRALAESRLTRAIEAIDKTMAQASTRRWSMDPSLEDERRAIIENSIQFYSGLIADSSDNEQVRFQAARAYHMVAGAKFILNDLSGAVQACEQGIQLSELLRQQNPENVKYVAIQSELYSLSGSVTFISGQAKAGIEDMQKSIELCSEILKQDPESEEYRAQVIESMANYAYFVLSGPQELRNSGEELLPEIRKHIQFLEARTDISWVSKLAIAFGENTRGVYDIYKSNIKESKPYFEKSRSIIKSIYEVTEWDSRKADHFYHTWAVTSINLGLCYLAEGPQSIEQGVSIIDEGLEPLGILIRAHPNTFVYKLQMVQALRAKASGLNSLNLTEAAQKIEQELAQLMQRIIQENPDQPWVQALQTPAQSMELVDRARHGKLDQLEDQIAQLQQRMSPNNRLPVLYNIVCAYSQATKFASTDDGLNYQKKAIDTLEVLRQSGYFKDEAIRAHARKDEDLAPIADKIDWDKLFTNP